MKYKASKIAEICGGSFISSNGFNPEIDHLLIDSRKIISSESALFIAISGERHKGIDFIPDELTAVECINRVPGSLFSWSK